MISCYIYANLVIAKSESTSATERLGIPPDGYKYLYLGAEYVLAQGHVYNGLQLFPLGTVLMEHQTSF